MRSSLAPGAHRPFANLTAQLAARLAVLVAAIGLCIQPVLAQSVLRDAETESLLQDMADPLIAAAGLNPGQVRIVLVGDSSINAFVAGGQAIYINSGLIEGADDANQVQGVIAHELGHVTGGHVITGQQGAANATKISLLSMLAGIAAAVAGAGDAAMGVMMLGQRAALGQYLAFSRVQESSADAAGASYLSKAGISGKGSIAFFKKLENMEYRYGVPHDEDTAFASTHPMSGERIQRLQSQYAADPAWNTATDPAIVVRFERVRAKLKGYMAKPQDTLRAYPPTMTGVPARYARAYAYHKLAKMDHALAETDALLERQPDDPYFLELKGQVLLESGHPDRAIAPLRRAVAITGNQPLIAGLFGHALIATEDRRHYDEAQDVLRAAVAKDRENPFAWYQLGTIYAAQGDEPRAQLASAEQQALSGEWMRAMRSAQAAEARLPSGSPDWLRAQDIAMQARGEVDRSKDRR